MKKKAFDFIGTLRYNDFTKLETNRINYIQSIAIL